MREINIFLSFVLFSLFFLSNSSIKAQEAQLEIAAFDGNRTGFILAGNDGGPPPGFALNSMGTLYSRLSNNGNFSLSGVVPCDAKFNNMISQISTGSLVDENGNLKSDIFFGAPTFAELTEEEAIELSKFLYAGGIVFISGQGPNDASHAEGVEYNLLLEKLEKEDRFLLENSSNTLPYLDSLPPLGSLVTDGPFGIIGPLRHGQFRKFNSEYLSGVVESGNSEGNLIYEGRIGKGYLVVATAVVFHNVFMNSDLDNINYFLNLFSLGCRDDWRDNAKVLDVPSFKQGIYPLGDNALTDPPWENEIYDSGFDMELDCDLDTLGVADGTIGECGCALSSIAMVMRHHGIDNGLIGIDIDPYTLNAMFQHFIDPVESPLRYGYSGGFVRWIGASNVSATAHENHPEQPKLEYSRENYNYDRIVDLINSNTPVILSVNGASHWVVVTGYDPDSQRLIINDPALPDPPVGGYTFLDTKYTPDAINSMVIYTPTYSDFRYIQIIADDEHVEIADTAGDPLTNMQYIFEASYVNPALSDAPPVGGIHTWTIKLPTDGEYIVKSAGPFEIYASDVEGNLSGELIEQDSTEHTYKLTYTEETAGEQIDIEEIAEEGLMKIDIRPWTDYNWINPKGLLPVPVAILSSNTFDAMSVNDKSIRFGASGTEKSLSFCLKTGVDVDDDDLNDKLCFFNERKLKAMKDTTQMTLTADNFSATDEVVVLSLKGIFSLF